MPDNMPETAAPLILLTRPQPAAERFAAACTARFGARARPVLAPLMAIVPHDPLPDLTGLTGLIFTSEPGVTVFGSLTDRRDLPAFCVGDRTAAAAASLGLAARSAGGTAEDLLRLVIDSVPPGSRMLHAHGVHVRGDLVARLGARGIAAQGAALYDQADLAPDASFRAAIAGPDRVLVPLFSPRSAALFSAAAGPRAAHVAPVAISAAVGAALPPDWRSGCATAPAPTADAVLQTLADLI